MREIQVSISKPIETDIKEATLLFGSQSVSNTGTADTLRFRFDAAPLDKELAKILGVQAQSEEYAAVTIAFHANYLRAFTTRTAAAACSYGLVCFDPDIEFPPIVKPIKKTKATLTASQTAQQQQVHLNERFSEVIATVTQQFLQKRWQSLTHAEKWEVNQLLAPKTSPLRKKTLKIAEHEHVHRSLILAQYDQEFAKELLESSLSSTKGKEAVDDDEEEAATTEKPAPAAPAAIPTNIPTPVNKNVTMNDLPGSAKWLDVATPWMSKLGVFFNCDQCGAKIHTVAWMCTVCSNYDLCDHCRKQYGAPQFFRKFRCGLTLLFFLCRGWEKYANGHSFSHPMVPLRYQSNCTVLSISSNRCET